MDVVWVVSGQTVERALIVAQLAEEGSQARGFESLADLFAALTQETPPRVLVIDPLQLQLDEANWERIGSLALSTRTLLILSAGVTPHPADSTLRRPFSIHELVGKIRQVDRETGS